MARLKVPVIVTITGEGGSGGALAIAIGDRVLMLENSIYSVISPEGCASIMWRDATKRDVAAEALRITAKDMVEFGVVDAVVPEPAGGAHRDHKAAADLLAAELQQTARRVEGALARSVAGGTLPEVPQNGAVLYGGMISPAGDGISLFLDSSVTIRVLGF